MDINIKNLKNLKKKLEQGKGEFIEKREIKALRWATEIAEKIFDGKD